MNITLAMFTINSGAKYNTIPIHEAKQLPQLKGLKLTPHFLCRLWIVLKNNDAQTLVIMI
jgi:hypothetical protein